MVPDIPSLSRRRALGGLAGSAGFAGIGTLGVGVAAPTALPDIVTDWWVSFYPTPPDASSLWRPTVTEAHAREAVELLEATATDNVELWQGIDSETHHVRGAGGWLEKAREELQRGNYPRALSHATYGIGIAGQSLGKARSIRDEVDFQAYAERGESLLKRIKSVSVALGSYPMSDPHRDLAWYVSIEEELQHGRNLADWYGRDEVLDEDEEFVPSGSSGEIEKIEGNLHKGEIAVRNAERYHTLLVEKLGDDATDYAEDLLITAENLRENLEGIPGRDEVRSRYIGDDPDSFGPYEFAHSRLATACFEPLGSNPFRTPVAEEFQVLQVLGLAKGLGRWRAHQSAVDALVIDPDDDGSDSGHALAEKRRAHAAYESAVGPSPEPFFTRLVDRAIEDIQVTDIDRGEGGHGELWQERVSAYVYALLGRTKLEVYPAIYDSVMELE